MKGIIIAAGKGTRLEPLTANFVYTMEVKHGIIFGSPEQAAYLKGFIFREQLQHLAKQMEKTAYGQHLLTIE